ncbi:MAG: FAD-dependent oxidoreductase [Actinomycetota bacterium]
MRELRVVIVGAGPAGLLLGCLLSRSGVDVTVLERNVQADLRSRAIGIHPPGVLALDRAGVGERIRADAVQLRGGSVSSGGRVLAEVDFPPERPVLTIAQGRTGVILDDQLESLSPGAVRRGVTVSAVHDRGGSVALETTGDAGEREYSADLVVLADGVRSTLRDQVGMGWRAARGHGDYTMMDLPDGEGEDGHRARLYFEREGLVEAFPLPGGARRWVIRESRRQERTASSFVDEVERRIGTRISTPHGVAPSTFRARQHRADLLWRGRVALLGDAAHEISPIGGQGMNLALLAATRLGDAITAGTQGTPPDLHEYERRSRAAAVIAQRRARFNMAMGAAQPGVVRAPRDVLIRGLARERWRSRVLDAMIMGGL